MSNESLTKKDLRKFGLLVGSIFIILFGVVLPYLKSRGFIPWPFIVGACFILPAVICPVCLRPVHSVWMKIGHVLGFINTRLIAVVMFLLIFTPVGLFMRLIGRDILHRKSDKKLQSYFIPVKEYDSKHMERPF